jgi:regulator of RNase E activity RraA
VDAQQPGDVMVVSTSTGSYWGELLATASKFRGARGIVGDCYSRDTAMLIEMRYPTFVAGALAYDSLGRIDVRSVGLPIECAGVTVHPGDLVIGDDDGVAIIPRGVAEEVITLAEEKVSGENLVRDKLAEGMPVAEAFRTYGVL